VRRAKRVIVVTPAYRVFKDLKDLKDRKVNRDRKVNQVSMVSRLIYNRSSMF
jgi:hypothetical protein